MNTIEENVHTIIQEEIAERVIYQDRHAEETLRRCLQSLESRMQIYARSLHTQGKLDALGEVEEYANGKWYAPREVAGSIEYTGSPVGVLGVSKFLSHIASLKEKAHAQS